MSEPGKPGDRGLTLRANADARPCAICKKPVVAEYRPFCSKRCADVDLNRWLGENYRIPTQDTPSSDQDLE